MLNFFRKFPLTSYQTDYKDPNSNQVVVDLFRGIKVDIDKIDNANAYILYDIQDGMRPDQISFELYETPEYFWTFFLINEHLRGGLHNWPKSYNQLVQFAENKYDRLVALPETKSGYSGLVGHLIAEKEIVIGSTIRGSVTGATATIDAIDASLNHLYFTNVNGTFSNTDALLLENGETFQNNTQYKVTFIAEINAPHHYVDTSGNRIERIPFSESDTNTYIPITNLQYEEDENDKYTSIRVLTPGMVDTFAETYKTVINA